MTDTTTIQDQAAGEKNLPLLRTKDVTVTYDLTHEALHKTSLDFEGGQVSAAHRPVRLRQVHVPALPEPHEPRDPQVLGGRPDPLPRP